MKTLIVYDEAGTILLTQSGNYKIPVGVPYIETEIPDGYYVDRINDNKAIFAELPKTEVELLREEVKELKSKLDNLIDFITAIKGSVKNE